MTVEFSLRQRSGSLLKPLAIEAWNGEHSLRPCLPSSSSVPERAFICRQQFFEQRVWATLPVLNELLRPRGRPSAARRRPLPLTAFPPTLGRLQSPVCCISAALLGPKGDEKEKRDREAVKRVREESEMREETSSGRAAV